MLGFMNQRDEVDILNSVVDCWDVLELDKQSLWLAPYQPSIGWNNGLTSRGLVFLAGACAGGAFNRF